MPYQLYMLSIPEVQFCDLEEDLVQLYYMTWSEIKDIDVSDPQASESN